jgi:hypothetical protein
MMKKIYAVYNKHTIRVYQAFRDEIADEALKLGHFGKNFKLSRMTWIKPSFLWMMYRSGWATKEGQERILAIDLTLEGFHEILQAAVLSTYDSNIYGTEENWRNKKETSEVRCQWDPDKNIYLQPLERRAIQIGLRGDMVYKYVNLWTTQITDLTESVHQMKYLYDQRRIKEIILPKETEFPVSETEKWLLGMDEGV